MNRGGKKNQARRGKREEGKGGEAERRRIWSGSAGRRWEVKWGM